MEYEYTQFALILFYAKYIFWQGFHFPLALLTCHIYALHIFLQLRAILCKSVGYAKEQQKIEEQDKKKNKTSSFASTISKIWAGFTTAMALACLLQAMMRFRSASFLYMLLPFAQMIILSGTMCERIKSMGNAFQLLVTTLGALASCAIIILGETTVDTVGLVFLVGAGLWWTARQFLRIDTPDAFVPTDDVVVIAFFVAGFMSLAFENVSLLIGDVLAASWNTILIHVFANLLLSIGLLLPFGLIEDEEKERSTGSYFYRFMVDGLLLLGSSSLVPSPVAYSQVIGYSLLRIFTHQLQSQHTKSKSAIPVLDEECLKRPVESPKKPRKTKESEVLWLVLPISIIFLARYQYEYWLQVTPQVPVVFDKTYTSPSHFEIVINAQRDESPQHIQDLLDDIETALLGSSPRVTIYSNNRSAQNYSSLSTTVDSHVNVVESVPGEPAYLQHILDNWDDIAQQTLFIPATISERRAFLSRLNTYFIPQRTGFLNLGSPTSTDCKCNYCGDASGWRFPNADILVNAIDGSVCDDFTRLPLTPGGRFVASGRRIRGVDRKLYEALHDHSVRGNMHQETIEKMWGVLMRCRDESVISGCPTYRAPGLLVGVENNEEACQCLDPSEEM